MKCKYCNGTGEHINDANRMTTCEFCGGTGEVEVVGDSVTDVCDKCGGTGFFCEMRMGDSCTLGSPCPHQEPLTNEEWFCGLSTEEKAKYIAKAMFFYDSQFGLTMVEALRKSIEYEDGLNETIEHYVVEWLKEKHNA